MTGLRHTLITAALLIVATPLAVTVILLAGFGLVALLLGVAL